MTKPKLSRFIAIPIKIPMVFSTELEQIILKFVWKHTRLWMVKTIYGWLPEQGDGGGEKWVEIERYKLKNFQLQNSVGYEMYSVGNISQ